MMIRPQPHQAQAGLLLRSLGAGGGARPGSTMKSATSLLLGAALATAFFLLYTSLCRDLGAAAPRSGSGSGSPPQWQQETAGTAAAGADRHEKRVGLVEPKRQQEAAGKGEGSTKHVAASSDGDGDGTGGATTEEKGQSKKQQPQQRIVMPATSSTQQQVIISLPSCYIPAFFICSTKTSRWGEEFARLLFVFF